jgi:hypothetical protein
MNARALRHDATTGIEMRDFAFGQSSEQSQRVER